VCDPLRTAKADAGHEEIRHRWSSHNDRGRPDRCIYRGPRGPDHLERSRVERIGKQMFGCLRNTVSSIVNALPRNGRRTAAASMSAGAAHLKATRVIGIS